MKVVSFVSLVLLSLIHDVLAIVQFSSPSAGATFATGTPINVAWEYTGLSNPSLGDDVRFDLFLCAGGNGNNDPQVVPGRFPTSSRVSSYLYPMLIYKSYRRNLQL